MLSPKPVPRHPGKVEFWISQYEMIHVWDLRVQSKPFISVRAITIQSDAVINLMKPETLSNFAPWLKGEAGSAKTHKSKQIVITVRWD